MKSERAKGSTFKYNVSDQNQHNTDEEERIAQLGITLDQVEIPPLFWEDRGEAFKSILKTSSNKVLQV